MELNQVSFGYQANQPLVRAFSATVPQGRILSILGPNGAGKSTLLGLLSGRLKPNAGQATLAGHSIFDMTLKERAAKIAVVSQHNAVYDDLAVIDVVKMGRLAFHSLFSVVSDSEVAPFIELAGLAKLANRQLSELSGGQQQRVWIAMAIAQEPEYLLLDEPTTYLDIRYQVELMNLVVNLQQKKQMTVVMVLHDINQALRVSADVWLIKAGELVKAGNAVTMLNESLLSSTFDFPVKIVNVPDYGPYVIEMPTGEESDNFGKLI